MTTSSTSESLVAATRNEPPAIVEPIPSVAQDGPFPAAPADFSTPAQRALLARLREWSLERSARERQIDADFSSERQRCQDEHAARQLALHDHHQVNLDRLNGEYLARLDEARVALEATRTAAAQGLHRERSAISERFQRAIQTGESNWSQTRAMALQNHDTDEEHAKEAILKARSILETCEQQFGWLRQHAETWLRRRSVALPPAKFPPAEPEVTTAQLIQHYTQAAERVGQLVRSLTTRWTSRFVDEGWPILIFVFVLIAVGIPLGLRSQWTGWHWPLTA
ncbi:MAG TPA: hypothetical protein VIY86_11250, partial [Pirellulaceae bacterium]